jgi:2'-5' RNA ligase
VSETLPIIDDETGKPVISYFVVSFVPEPLASALAEMAQNLPEGFEPQSPERMHITWRSFDGLPSGSLEPLKDALREICQSTEPFVAQISGGGEFDLGAVWAGITPSEAMTQLQVRIDEALSILGLPKATHTFVPHITIGHGAAGSQAPTALKNLSHAFPIDEVLLTTTGNQAYRVVVRTLLGEDAEE